MEWVRVTAEMLGWLESSGRTIVGKRCLELGTGRALGIPVCLWLCGAQQTVTVDLHRYLLPALVLECNRYYRDNIDEVYGILKDHDKDGGLRNRLESLASFSGDIGSFLKFINVEYQAPADARQLPFVDHSFDLHFSYSVLEHIPAPVILDIFKEAKRLLAADGVVLHTFDLSDHFFYSDSSITRINFLRFDDKQWARWAGNKYMYHNRLRVTEFLQLFEQVGLRIIQQSRTLDKRSLDALERGFPLHPRYKSASPKELAVIAMQVMGGFSEEPARAHRPGRTEQDLVLWKHVE
jgi:SAM-dependent methyltransferase